MSPVEDMHSQKPKKSLNLLPRSPHVREFESVRAFALYVHILYHAVSKQSE